jgi:hypothetical protein
LNVASPLQQKNNMKTRLTNSICFRESAGARTIVLVALTIGFAAGALLVYRSPKATPQTQSTEAALVLSESTKAVLGQLHSPVEIRFYALFGGDNPPARLREFAGQVSELLSVLEAEARGKLIVTRFDSWTSANTKNATSDGLVSFDTGSGDPIYLGIAAAQDKRKETLARLAPEWAAAVEFDLARVIARVGTPPPMPRTAEQVAQTGKAEEAVKRAIPNATATSLEDGKQILRDVALKAYQSLVGEMNGEVAKAEQAVQKAAGDTERQTALQKLQQMRAGYAERLREIALQSQAEMEAWTNLKGQ